MPCVLVVLAFFAPRLAVGLLWFFTHWFEGLFTSLLWYSAVQHWFGGAWTLWPVVGIVVALMIDLSPVRGHPRFRGRR